jgi:hypothetical protein
LRVGKVEALGDGGGVFPMKVSGAHGSEGATRGFKCARGGRCKRKLGRRGGGGGGRDCGWRQRGKDDDTRAARSNGAAQFFKGGARGVSQCDGGAGQERIR